MDVPEPLKMPEAWPKPLSMTPDAVRSRARREAAKAKPKAAKPQRSKTHRGKLLIQEDMRKKEAQKLKHKPKAKVKKRKADTVVRSERLDMRLTKAEKAKIIAKAKKTRRTVTSLVIEAIEKIR
jgi:hypothetical protein